MKTIPLAVLSLICILVFSGCCHIPQKQVVWEYKSLEGLPTDKQLSDYGKQGFVVDKVLMGNEGSNNQIRYFMLLKRRVP